MTGLQNDREKAPLMKDLHEIGLKHGCRFVVVAIPCREDSAIHEVKTPLIDHKDDTTLREAVNAFTSAGVFLIKVAAAGEELEHEIADKEGES